MNTYTVTDKAGNAVTPAMTFEGATRYMQTHRLSREDYTVTLYMPARRHPAPKVSPAAVADAYTDYTDALARVNNPLTPEYPARIDRTRAPRKADTVKAERVANRLNAGSRHKYGPVTVTARYGVVTVEFIATSRAYTYDAALTVSKIADAAVTASNDEAALSFCERRYLTVTGETNEVDPYADARADMNADRAADWAEAGIPAPEAEDAEALAAVNIAEDAAARILNTPALMGEARGWVHDNDVSTGGWSKADILDFIAAYYDGGLPAFISNSTHTEGN